MFLSEVDASNDAGGDTPQAIECRG